MRFDDLLGKPAVASRKAMSAVGDVEQRLSYCHTVLGNLAQRAGKEGRAEERVVCEEAQRAIWTAKRVLQSRAGEPAPKDIS